MNVLLALAWFALTALRMLFMVLALIVVVPAGWLELATEWIDRKRGYEITQVMDEQLDPEFHKQGCICWYCMHERGED